MFFASHHKKRSGFTLIEILIAVALIGILSSIAYAPLGQSRASARDAQRIADLKQLSQALDVFYEANSSYPCGLYGTEISNAGVFQSFSRSNEFPEVFLDGPRDTSGYCLAKRLGLITANIIPSAILDPINICPYPDAVTCNMYMYFAQTGARGPEYGPQSYVLYTKLENNDKLMQNDGGQCSKLYEVGPGITTMNPGQADNWFNTPHVGIGGCN